MSKDDSSMNECIGRIFAEVQQVGTVANEYLEKLAGRPGSGGVIPKNECIGRIFAEVQNVEDLIKNQSIAKPKNECIGRLFAEMTQLRADVEKLKKRK
jgi:hypothetical protein